MSKKPFKMEHDALKNHVLEVVVEHDRIQAYYLKRPGEGRMMSTLIVFSPEGITISGDLKPCNGAVSCYGYNRNWFSGVLGVDYLCEKFLQKKWTCEQAVEAIRWNIKNYDAEGRKQWRAVLADLKETWGTDDFTSTHLYDAMNTHDLDTSDGCPGYRYLDSEAGWLSAIQTAFAREYWKHVDRETNPGFEIWKAAHR